MLTENAELREEIDSLRVERTRYENIRKKLDKVIHLNRATRCPTVNAMLGKVVLPPYPTP